MWCEVKLQIHFFACNSLFIEKDIFAHWLPLSFFQKLIDQVPGWISQLNIRLLALAQVMRSSPWMGLPSQWVYLIQVAVRPVSSSQMTKLSSFFPTFFSFLFSFIVSAPFPLVAITTLFLAQLFLFLLTHKKEICSVFSASFEKENIFLGIF